MTTGHSFGPSVSRNVMRMEISDEALAKAAADVNAAAFSVLLERRCDGLFGLCFRLTCNRPEAEDAS